MITGSTQFALPRRRGISRWAIGLALVAAPPLLHAQQTGIVVGIVTDGATGQPLSGTTVAITGTPLGGQTDGRGHFIIRGVRSGPATVRAQRLGYRQELKPIAVPAGDSVRVTFALQQSAVTLSEVVTTGTGGAVSKRELGAPIGVVDADKIQDVKPSGDIGSILEGQVAGVRSTTVGGGVGGAKDLRIRGTSSFTLNQRPVVYIDGVRADTRATDWTANLGNQACCNFNGGTGEDRLSDLNSTTSIHIEVSQGCSGGHALWIGGVERRHSELHQEGKVIEPSTVGDQSGYGLPSSAHDLSEEPVSALCRTGWDARARHERDVDQERSVPVVRARKCRAAQRRRPISSRATTRRKSAAFSRTIRARATCG